MIYHYLDYCCRLKFFIASENRWTLNFLLYHMVLDTTSAKNLSQTLDFWVITIVFTSVFTSLCTLGIRLRLAMLSYFYKKFIFCSTNVLTVFWLELRRFILQALYQMAQKQFLLQLSYLYLGHMWYHRWCSPGLSSGASSL